MVKALLDLAAGWEIDQHQAVDIFQQKRQKWEQGGGYIENISLEDVLGWLNRSALSSCSRFPARSWTGIGSAISCLQAAVTIAGLFRLIFSVSAAAMLGIEGAAFN